jgi:hypothetical protein
MPEAPQPFSKLAEELVGEFRRVAYHEPRRAVKRPTKNLSAIIEELMIKNQIGRPSAEQSIRDQWPALVGTANATYSHAARIDRGRLIVLAAHSVVRNEIFHHRDEIVARIHKIPGCEAIKSLNIRAG